LPLVGTSSSTSTNSEQRKILIYLARNVPNELSNIRLNNHIIFSRSEFLRSSIKSHLCHAINSKNSLLCRRYCSRYKIMLAPVFFAQCLQDISAAIRALSSLLNFHPPSPTTPRSTTNIYAPGLTVNTQFTMAHHLLDLPFLL
jgi:hypothetical protein